MVYERFKSSRLWIKHFMCSIILTRALSYIPYIAVSHDYAGMTVKYCIIDTYIYQNFIIPHALLTLAGNSACCLWFIYLLFKQLWGLLMQAFTQLLNDRLRIFCWPAPLKQMVYIGIRVNNVSISTWNEEKHPNQIRAVCLFQQLFLFLVCSSYRGEMSRSSHGTGTPSTVY